MRRRDEAQWHLGGRAEAVSGSGRRGQRAHNSLRFGRFRCNQPRCSDRCKIAADEDVARRGDCIECACPACRDIGKDTAGNNLLIRPDGRYKCAAFINLSAAENHRHNQRIYWLAGIDAKEFEHD